MKTHQTLKQIYFNCRNIKGLSYNVPPDGWLIINARIRDTALKEEVLVCLSQYDH